MTKQSSTYVEHVGDGYYVTVQYCEYVYANGNVCDKYLGYNYPSVRCLAHQSK